MQVEPNAKAVQLVELGEQPQIGKPVFGSNMDLIQGIKVRLSACVGRREMTVKDLFALKEGEIVELDRASNDPVELYLDEKLVGRGELVVVGDNFGIRIVELGDSNMS